jgi:pimeloyl-ACP methyl ester carboxylesterase
MPTIDVGGAELFFTDSGVAPGQDGPPLLLVHGWTCDSHDWAFQLDEFSAGHRVLAVDLRGHGRSSVPATDYTVPRHAADLARLLELLGLDPVIAIGHSLGGSVAAVLAVEHPERVRAMVAIEPAYGQDKAALEWLRDAAEKFGDEAGNQLAAQLLGSTEPHTPGWLKTWHGRRALGMPPALLRQTFWDLYFCDPQISGQPQSDAYLARRRSPTLAFHRLPTMAAWEQSVLSHPLSHVICWEGAGHWLHQERAPEFNALVLAWVAEVSAFSDRTTVVLPRQHASLSGRSS